MAEIAPFYALRYDSSRVDMDKVLAPPYDVINESERTELEKHHECNVVHVELPRGEGDRKYDHARDLLQAWISRGMLRRDLKPAIYRYEQRFHWPKTAEGKEYVRRGFMALLKLEPFEKRIVLPHEKTLAAPKEDRRKLLLATQTQISPIFGLYRDPEGLAESALAACDNRPADIEVMGHHYSSQRMWVVDDQALIAKVQDVLRSRQIMIADGHHRYETMLSLSDEIRPAGLPPGGAAADWIAMFMCRAEDPGLLVLPTHRMVHDLPSFDMDALGQKAREAFEIWYDDETDPYALQNRLGELGDKTVTFAVRAAGRNQTMWMALRDTHDLTMLGHPTLRNLDVTVLHGLVLGPLLGIDATALSKQSYLAYTHDTAEAMRRVSSGEVQASFFMNPSRVDQILAACEEGLVMPQKSSYFQPKLATGLVMYQLEDIAHS